MNVTAKSTAKSTAKTTEKPATEKPATEKPATEKPATEKPATEKPAKPAVSLDLSALSVEAAPAPKMKGHAGAGRKKADNSVAEGWLRDSWDARENGAKMGSGKKVSVPVAVVGTLRSRLNTAAETLGLGVAIQVTEQGETAHVVFAAKVRKVRAPKVATAPATTPVAAPAGK